MNRVTVELTPYVPAADLFRLVCHQPDCAFLDSSLVNDLGRWSIIGLKPYETFVKEHDGTFTRNGQPQTGISFDDSLQSYLRTHQDENQTGLPMVSGAIAPLFAPLGLGDWRICTALICGVMAKESVVSTLEVLFGGSITAALSPLAAACLLVFSLLYTPCVAAIASIKRELGTRWAVAVVVWQCALAWVAASIVHLVGLLLGVGL